MFLVAIGILGLLSVPIAGGRLSKLAEVELCGVPFIFGSVAIQVAITTIVPGGDRTLLQALHIISYLLAAAFVVANRRLPGMTFVAAGALSNAIAIFANGGVMPATRAALRAAGEPTTTKSFLNSAALTHPRLSILGDIFAIPKPLPLHNVFSLGDIAIALGTIIALHTICDSRLAWRAARTRPKHPAGDR